MQRPRALGLALALLAGCGSKSTATTTMTTGNDVEGDARANPASCAPTLTATPGHCEAGDSCTYPDGYCFCDGYHGGIPPEPGVDYSHVVCARTRGRTDGCPDDLAAGVACATEGQYGLAGEGLGCGPLLTCVDGAWVGGRDTCAEIP